VLTFGIEKRRHQGDGFYRLESVEVQGNGAAATFSWTAADGSHHHWAQALVLRNGQIAHIQDFADPAKALKAILRP
jgi:hypothetical protein